MLPGTYTLYFIEEYGVTSGTGADAYQSFAASDDSVNLTVSPLPVPEPSTWAMLATAGILAVAGRLKRRC